MCVKRSSPGVSARPAPTSCPRVSVSSKSTSVVSVFQYGQLHLHCLLGSTRLYSWVNEIVFLGQRDCILGSTRLYSWVNEIVFLGQRDCILGSKIWYSWVKEIVYLAQLDCILGSTRLYFWVNKIVFLGQQDCILGSTSYDYFSYVRMSVS